MIQMESNFIRFYNHKRRAIFSETVPYDVCIPSLAVYHLVNPSQRANYCLGEDMTHAAWTVWAWSFEHPLVEFTGFEIYRLLFSARR